MMTNPPGVEPTAQDHELIRIAQGAIAAVSDDEHGTHSMGSAVRTSDGSVFRGIDLIHATGGPAAELVAIANARASGCRQMRTIATVGSEGRGLLAPCGRIRQVLLDYFPTIKVIVPIDRTPQVVRIRDLVPLGLQWAVDYGFVPRFDDELPTDYDWPDDV
jgi:cytidine deaminase